MHKGISKDSFVGVGAIILLALWSVSLFLLALLSGAEAAGGVTSVAANSSNALPWLVPIVLTYVTWKRQILGGSLLILFGIASIFIFNTYLSAVALIIISAPSILLGALLMTQNIWDKSIQLTDEQPL